MRKLLLHSILGLASLYVVFWLMDEAFTRVFQQGHYTKAQWLYKIDGERYDFAIHGSSRAYTTVDISEIEKETQLKGINLSVDGSNITDQYLMLKLFLDHNNVIDQLYLQVDPWSANNEDVTPFAVPKFFPYLKEEEVFDHFKQFGRQWYAYRYVPFYRYAEYNTLWGVHQVLNDAFDLIPQDFDKYGGYFYPDSIVFKNENMPEKFVFDLGEKYRFLNKIIDLCKSRNIRLTLFTAPIANVRVDENYEHNIYLFKEIMSAHGVEYVNYANLYGRSVEMFTDNIHLRQTGAKDFTKRITERLLDDRTESAD